VLENLFDGLMLPKQLVGGLDADSVDGREVVAAGKDLGERAGNIELLQASARL
jgi:hypothetical protein